MQVSYKYRSNTGFAQYNETHQSILKRDVRHLASDGNCSHFFLWSSCAENANRGSSSIAVPRPLREPPPPWEPLVAPSCETNSWNDTAHESSLKAILVSSLCVKPSMGRQRKRCEGNLPEHNLIKQTIARSNELDHCQLNSDVGSNQKVGIKLSELPKGQFEFQSFKCSKWPGSFNRLLIKKHQKKIDSFWKTKYCLLVRKNK